MVGEIALQKDNFPQNGDTLIYFLFQEGFDKEKNFQLLDKKTKGRLKEKIKVYDFKAKENEVITLELFDFYKNIIILGLGEKKDFSLAKWRDILASGFRQAQVLKSPVVNIFYDSFLGKDFFEIGKNLSLSFYLANYFFDKYKGEEERKKIHWLKQLNFYFKNSSLELKKGIDYGRLISEGIYLTRDLVNQPALDLHPQSLVETAFLIEKESQGKIKVEILDEEECQKLGMGAFLAVGKGSYNKPKFIVLKYHPLGIKNEKKEKICLIGKSITFDSGGLSLKPAQAMETMKIDMAGGATVLGIFKILAHLDKDKHGVFFNHNIFGILPACENMPSGNALKPGDILSTLSGKTVEVINTDAEGRLTLSDALSFAEKYLRSSVIIDLATLTGACMVALGDKITGMWGNDEKTNDDFLKAAKKEKEKVHLMPLEKDYIDGLRSDIADLKNVTDSSYGGAITAALFLSEFVKKAKWIHLDIAGTAYHQKEPKGIFAKGATGWGVLSILEFLKIKN
jgi:leucyl aminopeptidase